MSNKQIGRSVLFQGLKQTSKPSRTHKQKKYLQHKHFDKKKLSSTYHVGYSVPYTQFPCII